MPLLHKCRGVGMAIDLGNKRQSLPLMWPEAVRAFICMLPMLIASSLGASPYLVALGQGGFFDSSLFLPKKTSSRIVMGTLILALGLGFYLMGGDVAPNPWVAIFFTLLVCVTLSFLSGWKVGGPLALTFVMIYTAGLNTGSAEKAASNFFVFAFVLGWSALISLLPFLGIHRTSARKLRSWQRGVCGAGHAHGHWLSVSTGSVLPVWFCQTGLGVKCRRQRRALRTKTIAATRPGPFLGNSRWRGACDRGIGIRP